MTVDVAAGVALAAQVTAVGVGAVAVARWAVAGTGRAIDRAVVGAVAALAQICGVSLWLLVVGALGRGTAVGAHAVVAGALVALTQRRRPGVDTGQRRHRAPRGAFGASGALVGAVSAGLGSLAAVVSLRGGSRDFDTVQYHVVNAATWLRTGSLWQLPFANPGYFTAAYPGNGELVGTWLALPSHHDELVYAAPVAFGVLAVVASGLLARQLGARAVAGLAAAVAVAAAPVSFWTQARSLSTDLAAAAGVVAALALLLVGRDDPGHRRWPVLAGVALGLSVGAKYTALVPAAAVVAAAAILAPSRRRATWLVSLLPGLVLLAGPWFLRTWIETGNPLFPQRIAVGGVELFGGGESPLTAYATTIGDHVVNARRPILGDWVRLTGRFVGPVLALLLPAVVAGAVVAWRRRAIVLAAVTAVAVVSLAAYLLTPYTGGGPDGLEFLIGSQLRYALPFAFVAAAVGAATLPRAFTAAAVVASWLYAAWRIVEGPGFRPDLDVDARALAVALLLAATAAVVAAAPTAARRFAAWVAPVGVAVAAAVGFAELRLPTPPAARAAVLAERVAVVGVGDVRAVLGPRLETELVSLADGGRAGERPADDHATLDARLAEVDADVVVVGRRETVSAPADWRPPADRWTKVGETADAEVYVRAPDDTPEPPDAPEPPDPPDAPEPPDAPDAPDAPPPDVPDPGR